MSAQEWDRLSRFVSALHDDELPRVWLKDYPTDGTIPELLASIAVTLAYRTRHWYSFRWASWRDCFLGWWADRVKMRDNTR